ncbi:MAG: AMP-dependent synthetase/ligase [Candidatus Nanopelagicales bacterium]
MRSAGSLTTPIPAHAPNLARSILDRIHNTPEREAFRAPVGGDWRSWTYREFGDEVLKLAAGLMSLGLELEDRVAIASSTRYEWIFADCAIMCAGGANTTIYPSTSDIEVAFVLADSGTRILIAENEKQAAKVLHQLDKLPELRKIVLIDGEGDGDFVITLADLAELGVAKLTADPKAIENRVAQLTGDSLATLIYTSGTTGRPKGVELLHRCWVFEGASIEALNILNQDDLQYLWLPLSHVFGKVLLSIQMQIGFTTAVDGRITEIVPNLAVVRPTFMAGVPRIFEKIYNGARGKAASGGGTKKVIFDWAFGSSAAIRQARRAGRGAGPLAGAQMAVADKLVFTKLRELTGGRIRWFVSGSAALNHEVARWFDAAGMTILEGYGLSENSAAACLQRPESVAFGYVGPPLPGSEVMIADDGEILLRGPHVMRGYRNLPEETARVMLPDGWLATGDIGELDFEGRLRITDRKKDMVKTSGGKYIAPGAIESQFKAMSGLASNLIVHANNRNFATALVTLDAEALEKFAAERGLTGDFATLSQHPLVHAEIKKTMDELNSKLNRWETVKKFTILDRDLSEADGEITASLKVKRRVVEENFADTIDRMYGAEDSPGL